MQEKHSLQMPAWNFMAMTEPLWLLYCRVQSPNSVTQHLADPSAEPLYISRFTTRIQITAFVCPSIVWQGKMLSRNVKIGKFSDTTSKVSWKDARKKEQAVGKLYLGSVIRLPSILSKQPWLLCSTFFWILQRE